MSDAPKWIRKSHRARGFRLVIPGGWGGQGNAAEGLFCLILLLAEKKPVATKGLQEIRHREARSPVSGFFRSVNPGPSLPSLRVDGVPRTAASILHRPLVQQLTLNKQRLSHWVLGTILALWVQEGTKQTRSGGS